MGGVTGVVFLRSCQKLSPCPTKPEPASPAADPALAMAGPITHGDNASGITYLRRKKLSHRSNCSQRRRNRQYVKETVLQKLRKCSRQWGRDFSAGCGYDCGKTGCRLTEVQGGSDTHLWDVENQTHARAGGCDQRRLTLWVSHAREWQDLQSHKTRSLCWGRFPSRT